MEEGAPSASESPGGRLVFPLARIALATSLLVAALALTALSTQTAGAATGGPEASAAAKRCPAGKVAVRRAGRGAVCARKCPIGRKHKVSRSGRVRCVAKRKAAPAPAPQAPAGSPSTPPAGDAPPPPGPTAGPAAGAYSGTTDHSRPVTFNVADGQVTNFEAGVNTWCSTQGNQRVAFDAIASIPPLPIGPDGSFSYSGDETNGNVEIRGKVVGASATGTVGMNRGDTNYSGGQMYFGSCSATDVPWSAATG